MLPDVDEVDIHHRIVVEDVLHDFWWQLILKDLSTENFINYFPTVAFGDFWLRYMVIYGTYSNGFSSPRSLVSPTPISMLLR